MKKRTAPRVEDANLQRVVIDIYDILNELIGRLNSHKNRKDHEGEVGEIKVVSSGGKYKFQVKTKDGWYESKVDLKPRQKLTGN